MTHEYIINVNDELNTFIKKEAKRLRASPEILIEAYLLAMCKISRSRNIGKNKNT